MSLKALSTHSTTVANPSHLPAHGTSLMEAAMRDDSPLPLEAMVKFVRVAHIYQQKEVMEILGEKVIQATQLSNNHIVVCRGKALQLMLAMELLSKARMVASDTGPPQGAPRRAGMVSGRAVGAASASQRDTDRRVSGVGTEDSGRLSAGPALARLSPLLGASRRFKKLAQARRSPQPSESTKAGSRKSLSPAPTLRGDTLSPTLGVAGRSGGSKSPTGPSTGGKSSTRGRRSKGDSRKLSGDSDKVSVAETSK